MLSFLGIGLGKVDLSLDRVVFKPGDTIRGRMKFSLKEPTPARRLAVGLYGRQRAVSTSNGSGGVRTVGHRVDDVYKFEHVIAGEDLYTHGDHGFEIVIPSYVLSGARGVDAPPGTLGDVVRAISFLSPQKQFPVEWEIRAFVDLPFKLNPKSSMSITITEYVNPA
jgi:hypothetical protein